MISHELQKRTSKSALKSSRQQQNHLVDNAADILASMIKTRRSMYEKYLLSQQVKPFITRKTLRYYFF